MASFMLYVVDKYRIAGIFRGYKFSRMDHYKRFRGFYFRGLSASLLAHVHINMQLYLHTVSLESRPSLYGEAPLIVDRCGQ